VIYNPVPEADWKKELPAHSLMPMSELWRYFRYTHDTLTLRQVYPALRKYLLLWQLQPNGQLVYRKGGWAWGENQDFVLIQHGWYLRALQTAGQVAALLGKAGDGADYDKRIAALRGFLNGPDCWNGRAYHHKAHQGLTDDRANALMVVAGVADSTKWEALAGVFRQSEHASPWMEKFVLESLFLMGKPGQALDRMRRRFGPMTESPLSTLWEIWRHEPGEAHGNSGYNHGWAGGPLVLLSEYMAGIAPGARPGSYTIAPTLADLTGLNTTCPTPRGPLAGLHSPGGGPVDHCSKRTAGNRRPGRHAHGRKKAGFAHAQREKHSAYCRRPPGPRICRGRPGSAYLYRAGGQRGVNLRLWALPRLPGKSGKPGAFDGGPFLVQDAVVHRIAHPAGARAQVFPQDAFFGGPDLTHGLPRGEVEHVGLQFHPYHPQGLEGKFEQFVLAGAVQARALKRFADPGPANLHPAVGERKVTQAGAAGNLVHRFVEDREREGAALHPLGNCRLEVPRHFVAVGDRGERKLP
jgi:hypothetical protein